MATAEKTTPNDNALSGIYVTEIEAKSKLLLEEINTTDDYLKKIYSEMTDDDISKISEENVDEKYNSYKRASKNIFKSYQKLILMQDEFSTRVKDIIKFKKNRSSFPSNTLIDMKERKASHFAAGLNLYKLQLLCFFGSFAGVVIEMLWCLISRGRIESRAGLVYGPFNLLYGFGAVCMTLCLYKLRNRNSIFSFAGGFIVGSVFEYICSFLQETFFGSVSWDYSNHPFNLNGRICLLYSVFWGALGVLWMKALYPWIAKIILKLPNKKGKLLTYALSVFLAVNAVITVIAVYRWSQRISGIPASNDFFRFVDLRFTDARMKMIFPNMMF